MSVKLKLNLQGDQTLDPLKPCGVMPQDMALQDGDFIIILGQLASRRT